MAFNHLAGVTTPGAPDEVIDWFTTFEAWMLGIGWTVEAGAGTQDITFRSLSEAGGLTMLYLRAWRDLVNVNRVYFRVQDDLAGTHFTTPLAGGYVDSGGVQFAYWMSGDMDAIVVCFKLGAGYRHVYAGMVIPFALTVPDETYRMIVATDVVTATILRNHTGLWDVDSFLIYNPYMYEARINRFDGSYTLCGTYFENGVDIAGQLKHITGGIEEVAITAEDTIDTGRPGATSTWVVLSDRLNVRFAIRTGGVLPTGIPDGTFAATSGVAVNYAALWAHLSAHMVGLGWTDLGDPGAWTDSRLYYSHGESGEEDIYVLFAYNAFAGGELRVEVWNDAVGTHRTTGTFSHMTPGEFPANYWICGDKDCVVLIIERAIGFSHWWGGMLAPFPGGLIAPYAGPPLTEYSLVSAASPPPGAATTRVLHDHDGVWDAAVWLFSDGFPARNSNPNAFDGVTYLVWPFTVYGQLPGVEYDALGQMKYVFFSHGGGIANMDTITVGGRVYTIFIDASIAPDNHFAIRTA